MYMKTTEILLEDQGYQSRKKLSLPLTDSEYKTDNDSWNSESTVASSHIFTKRNTPNSVKISAFKGEGMKLKMKNFHKQVCFISHT